jgi:hypothetical protein
VNAPVWGLYMEFEAGDMPPAMLGRLVFPGVAGTGVGEPAGLPAIDIADG